MKRGTPDHHKMMALARELKVPSRYALAWANGTMERLWHYTARLYPQGDIGSAPDWAIADACGWECRKRGDRCGIDASRARQFVDALLTVGWLDPDGRCRYLVHDWSEHADKSVKTYLQNKGLSFLSRLDSEKPENKIPPPLAPAPAPDRPIPSTGAGVSSGSSTAPSQPTPPAAPARPLPAVQKPPTLQTNGLAPPDATDWQARYEGVYALYPLPGWKPEGQMRYVEIIAASVDQHEAAGAIDRSVVEWGVFWRANPAEHVPGIGKWFSDGYYLRKPEVRANGNRKKEPTISEIVSQVVEESYAAKPKQTKRAH